MTANVLLILALVMLATCRGAPRSQPAPPRPAVQCYAIWPDTGPRPPFLPEHLILGANPVGGIGFHAAGVSPNHVQSSSQGEQVSIYARWTSYGKVFSAESIYV